MRAALILAALVGTVSAAWAESNGPVIAIPGRPGVPVIINGVDASYRVVEGDWGLDKGVHMAPTVYGGVPAEPDPPVGHYYPSSGRMPGFGRLEIEPATKPRPAESFRQTWTSESKPQVQEPPIPAYPPPVIVAPEFRDPRARRFRP